MEMKKNTKIPKFDLYGEEKNRSQPELVHIEKISERSRKNDWKIKPHRHGKLYQVLVLYNGNTRVCLDDKNHNLIGNWIICIPAGTVHGFYFPAETKGEVLTMDEALILADEPQLQPYLESLLNQPQLIQFKETDALFKQIQQHLNLIRKEINNSEQGHTLMLNWLVKMILINLKRQFDNHPQQGQNKNKQKKIMLNNFRQMLEENYRLHWNVQQYAEALHTSTSSLNRLCLEHIGHTAKTIIQDRLLIEIKRRLIYTREALDSIAYSLGFKDPSYFSRFFKKLEALSPSEYRHLKYHETETTVS